MLAAICDEWGEWRNIPFKMNIMKFSMTSPHPLDDVDDVETLIF